jgi:hypothetical protein
MDLNMFKNHELNINSFSDSSTKKDFKLIDISNNVEVNNFSMKYLHNGCMKIESMERILCKYILMKCECAFRKILCINRLSGRDVC